MHIEIFLSVSAKDSESSNISDDSMAVTFEGFVVFQCAANKEVCWKLSHSYAQNPAVHVCL